MKLFTGTECKYTLHGAFFLLLLHIPSDVKAWYEGDGACTVSSDKEFCLSDSSDGRSSTGALMVQYTTENFQVQVWSLSSEKDSLVGVAFSKNPQIGVNPIPALYCIDGKEMKSAKLDQSGTLNPGDEIIGHKPRQYEPECKYELAKSFKISETFYHLHQTPIYVFLLNGGVAVNDSISGVKTIKSSDKESLWKYVSKDEPEEFPDTPESTAKEKELPQPEGGEPGEEGDASAHILKTDPLFVIFVGALLEIFIAYLCGINIQT